jgi:hypothetical protein
MRRDHVTLNVRDVDTESNRVPTMTVTVDEPTDHLEDRLIPTDGKQLDADDIDAVFRLQTPVDDEAACGVFSLSNRITGEFVLEVNADADAILDLVDVARTEDANGEGHYRIVVRQDGSELAGYEKRALLVYDEAGNLLRGRSLIPSGVEL